MGGFGGVKRGSRSRSAEESPEDRRGTYSHFGYHAARVQSNDGTSATPGSGDAHAQPDRLRLIDQARQFMRDNGIYKRMINGATSYIVGTGFGLQAKTADPEWNARAEAYWNEFWEKPELRGIQSGVEIEQAVCNELLGIGDVGVIKTNRAKVQVIESEQIKGTRANDDGLVRDKDGAITGFKVAPWKLAGAPAAAEAHPYTTENFLFLTRPERPSMARSVPPCQSSFPMLHRIKDVCDSEAIAWQMLAKFAVLINKENADLLGSQASREDDTKSSDTSGHAATRITELDTALIVWGKKDEKVSGVERNIPGKDFTQSLTTFIRLGGLPLGMPLEVILLDWTKSNYSQSRAVLEQFHTSFKGWQLLLKIFFHKPVYRWAIDIAVKNGALAKRDDQYLHDWIMPTFPWIDQLKETQAYGAKLDRAFCTHSQVLKGQGLDREEVLTTREREVIDAGARAERVEKAVGKPIPGLLEHFAGLAPAAGAPTPAADPAAEEEETPKKGGEESSWMRQGELSGLARVLHTMRAG